MTELIRLGTNPQALDPELVQEGRELEAPAFLRRPGLKAWVLPAAMYNPRYRRAIETWAVRAAVRGLSVGAKTGDANAETEDLIASWDADGEFCAKALVAKLGGLYGADGLELEYTEARGIQVLSAPENADVLAWIVAEARRYADFYQKAVADEGNGSGDGSLSRKVGGGKSRRTRSS